LAQEGRVRRRADRHGEKTMTTEILADVGEQLRVVANLTVGDEDDLLHQAALPGLAESDLERRQHFGAAGRLEILYVFARRRQMIRIGRHAARKKGVRRRVELDDVEPV